MYSPRLANTEYSHPRCLPNKDHHLHKSTLDNIYLLWFVASFGLLKQSQRNLIPWITQGIFELSAK